MHFVLMWIKLFDFKDVFVCICKKKKKLSITCSYIFIFIVEHRQKNSLYKTDVCGVTQCGIIVSLDPAIQEMLLLETNYQVNC